MTIASIIPSKGLMSRFSECKSSKLRVNILINKEIKLKSINMSKNPPLKSAQNKTLGASVFHKYKSFVPKTEIDSPRYNNLVKSAVQIKDLNSEYAGFKMRNTKNFELRKVAKKILNR